LGKIRGTVQQWLNERDHVYRIESPGIGRSSPDWTCRYNKRGCTLRHAEKESQSLKGRGFKSHYREIKTGDEYWISGPRRDGADRLYVSNIPV